MRLPRRAELQPHPLGCESDTVQSLIYQPGLPRPGERRRGSRRILKKNSEPMGSHLPRYGSFRQLTVDSPQAVINLLTIAYRPPVRRPIVQALQALFGPLPGLLQIVRMPFIEFS